MDLLQQFNLLPPTLDRDDPAFPAAYKEYCKQERVLELLKMIQNFRTHVGGLCSHMDCQGYSADFKEWFRTEAIRCLTEIKFNQRLEL